MSTDYITKNKLQGVHNFEDAVNVFKDIPKQSSPMQMTYFTEETLLQKIAGWRKTLEDNDVRRSETRKKLVDLPLNAKAEPLRQLCLELLDNTNCSLECNYPSLMRCLNVLDIQALFNYMVELEDAPKPKNPLSSAFAALTPRNEQHAFCLQLINNISAKYHSRHLPEHAAFNSDANDFMQNLLIVYGNLFPVVQETPEDSNDDAPGCCLVS